MPKISKDESWNLYNSGQHVQLGKPSKPAPVHQYDQELEEYQIRWLDQDGESMISNKIKTMKFGNGLIPGLKQKVRPLVHRRIRFDEIVSIAVKNQRTIKLTLLQQPANKDEQFKQSYIGKPMHLTKSHYKIPPNVAAAQQLAEPYSEAKHSVNFVYDRNARKDKIKYHTFGQQNTDKDQVAKEGKFLLCKTSVDMATDCPTRKVSSIYQQVNSKPRYIVKSISLSVESEVHTSHLQVISPATHKKRVFIPVS